MRRATRLGFSTILVRQAGMNSKHWSRRPIRNGRVPPPCEAMIFSFWYRSKNPS